MNDHFSRKTFLYLDEAALNRKSLKWFEKNRTLYDEEVKSPFSKLLRNLGNALAPKFPDLSFHPGRISLPVYREENIPEDHTRVKPFTWAFLSEKRTSLFEWNPGINIYIGSEEITVGMGLYHPSARQMGLLRESLMKNPESLKKILSAKKFQTTWGELCGERYARFPRGVDPGIKGAEYLWFKQFVVTRKLTRKDVISHDFQEKLIADLTSGAAFLGWLRENVGVYERNRAA